MINLKLLKRLGELYSFKTSEEIDEFLEIIEKIASLQDPDYLPFLFFFLKDDPEYVYVRDYIMDAIESYPDVIFVIYIIQNVKIYFDEIPECLIMFLWVIFNTQSCLDILKRYIHCADKSTMLSLLTYMEKDEPLEQHKPIIKELKELVEHPKVKSDPPGRHQQTRTFGGKSKVESRLNPRDELAADIHDIRRIYQKQGVYDAKIREGLSYVVKENLESFPEIFKKQDKND